MRWLAGLVLLLAVLVALVWMRTESGPAADPLASEAPTGPEPTARSGSAELVEVDAGPVVDSSPEPGRLSIGTSARAPTSRGPVALRGRVRRASGDPAVHVQVGLFAPAAREDGMSSPFAPVFTGNDALRQFLRVVKTWTRTDEAGNFAFEDPEPGTWIVRAEDGPLLAAASEPFFLEQSAIPSAIEIVFPPEAWLEGRVILPPGGSMPSSCLELRAHAQFSIARWMQASGDLVGSVRCLPDDELRFRLGPVETGLFTVGIVIDRELERRGRPDPIAGAVVPILDLYLAAGVTQRDLDVRGGLPGSIRLTLDLGSFQPRPVVRNRFAPAHDVRITAIPWEGAQRVFAVQVNASVSDPIEIGPLAAGAWRLSAQFPSEGSWTWPLGDPVVVESARRAEVRVALSIARHAFTVQEADGGALLTGTIEVGSNAGGGLETASDGLELALYTLRAPGQLDLVLPPGLYMVTAREEGLHGVVDDPTRWAKLEWDASGPRTTTLRVPR